MTQRLWGIHNDHPELGLVDSGFVSVGWDEVGDLAVLDANRNAFKAALRETCPDDKEGARPSVPPAEGARLMSMTTARGPRRQDRALRPR